MEHNGETYKNIIIDNIEFQINLDDVDYIFDYIPIRAVYPFEGEYYIVFTTILDKEFNPVIPLRKEIISLADLLEEQARYDILIFKNHKIIYINGEYAYLINLKETKFIEQDGEYIPNKYILKFNAVYNLGNGKIIVYDKNNSFIYNVDEEKKESKNYTFIKPSDTPDVFVAHHFIKNKYFYPLFAELKIGYENKIYGELKLGENIFLTPPKSLLKSKTKLIRYCDSYYNDLVEKGKERKCRKLIQ